MRECLQVVVNLRTKKRLVSRVSGVGVHRIRFDVDSLDEIADAITRGNIRGLITANKITFKPIVGTSRGRARKKQIQKKKRGAGQCSKMCLISNGITTNFFVQFPKLLVCYFLSVFCNTQNISQ